jgi:hypothetical protein
MSIPPDMFAGLKPVIGDWAISHVSVSLIMRVAQSGLFAQSLGSSTLAVAEARVSSHARLS